MRHYLEQQHIDSVKINGIGPTRKVILASYGIETAADVEQAQIMTIPGFGLSLTLSLVQWRKSLESKFTYNSQNATTSVEMAKLQYQHEAEYIPLESALLAGVEEIKRIKEKISLKHKELTEEAERRSSVYAQAQANWSLLKHSLEQVQRREAAKLTEFSSTKSTTTVHVLPSSKSASLPSSPNNTSANQVSASQPSSSNTVNQSLQPNSLSQIPILASASPPLGPAVTDQTVNAIVEPQLVKSTSMPSISSTNSTSVDLTIPSLNTNNQPPKIKKKFTEIDVIALILILMLFFFSVLLLYNAFGT